MPKLADRALTDTFLRNLKPPARRVDHFDAVQRGLGVRIAPSGLKTWFVMRRVNGVMKRVTIGRYPEVSLAAARTQAVHVLERIAKGEAPVSKAPMSVAALMEEWFSREQHSRKGADEKRRALRYDLLPALGTRPIDQVTRADIRDLVDRIVDRGAPIHANRVLAYVRRMFAWAAERDLITASPAAGVKPPTQERSRDRALSQTELASVWRATFGLPAPFDACFRMLVLTGQRRSEVAEARWSEIDFERGEWTIPAYRSKNGSTHLVHLSREARDNLAGVARHHDCDLVFTTTGTTPISGFSKIKLALDEASGVRGWTIHDLRRTFATIGTGSLGIDPVVMDKMLNHRSGVVTGVAAVYQRHAYLEQRKEAMDRWGHFVGNLENC
ncbi:MAG: integrase arm-type DNA-binding domain-containing protein [Rhizobiaceae bacterium]|nr:integrase arm-type DNA-binding domain-containing protein [Rhizobiaceae bacterium]MCV0409061.1 integrase arm-type DNA-binding domain-containing protein [Rhizobiaceae bacterium]